MTGLTFLSPWRLLALFAVLALTITYVIFQRRRSQYAVRFTNLELLSSGGSEAPDVLLQGLGVDVNDLAFWELGLKQLDDMVSDAETLAGQVGL